MDGNYLSVIWILIGIIFVFCETNSKNKKIKKICFTIYMFAFFASLYVQCS